jgi:hypothetical protein
MPELKLRLPKQTMRSLLGFRNPPISAKALGKLADPGFDLLENFLISARVCAIGIFDIPFLEDPTGTPTRLAIHGTVEPAVKRYAGDINDHVGGFEHVAVKGLRRESICGITVGAEGLLRAFGDAAQGVEPGASWFDDVGGFAAGYGLGHRTAAGVADTDEQDAESPRRGHNHIVVPWEQLETKPAGSRRYR